MKTFTLATALAAIACFSGMAAAASSSDLNVVAMDFQRIPKPRSVSSTSSSASHNRRGLYRRAGTANEQITYDGSLFFLNISVGTPAQNMGVYVDTGSSDLWLPATGGDADFCETTQAGCGNLGGFDPSKSSSFKELQGMGTFEIEYGDGTAIEGEYFTDNINIGNVKLTNVTMAVAEKGDTSYPISGIMGVGYTTDEAPTEAEERSGKLTPYPNIIASLKNQGAISTLAYSLYLNDLNAGQGTILFGGIDKAKYTGNLMVVPIQPDPAFAQYVASEGGSSSTLASSNDSVVDAFYVSLTGVSFSNSSANTKYDLGMSSAPVLLDSGTSTMYLPDAMVASIYKQFGAAVDETFGPVIPCNTPDGSFSFTFGSGGPVVNVSMSQVIIPFTDADLNGTQLPTFSNGATACQFGISGAGDSQQSQGGSGGGGGQQQQEVTYILGDTFMSSAYIVYDLTNNEIGLAQAKFNATDTSSIIQISSTIPADSTVTGASYTVESTPMTIKSTKAPIATETDLGALAGLETSLSMGTATATATGHSNGGSAGSATHAGTTAAAATSQSSAHGLRMSCAGLSSIMLVGMTVAFGLTGGGALLAWL